MKLGTKKGLGEDLYLVFMATISLAVFHCIFEKFMLNIAALRLVNLAIIKLPLVSFALKKLALKTLHFSIDTL